MGVFFISGSEQANCFACVGDLKDGVMFKILFDLISNRRVQVGGA